MRKFFTADLHFGDRGLIDKMGRKGFASIEEHDATILENINRKVGRHDYLFILGDFGNVKKRHQIRCRHVVYIIGNHDKRRECERTFGQIYVDKVIKFGGTKAVLYHYPIAFWNGSHKSWYQFYGHCHDQREGTLDGVWPMRRSMDVGLDTAYRYLGKHEPFSEDELVSILGDQPGHDPVEFYKNLRGGRA